MGEVVVRVVAPSDAVDLQRHCFVRNTPDETSQRIAANIAMFVRGEGVQYVAEVDGHAVATMDIAISQHPLFAHRAELGSVVTGSEYQGRGIARKIFEHCASYCRSMGLQYITVGVRGGEPAEKVYGRLGFTEYGRLCGGICEPWSGNSFDQVLLVYSLNDSQESGGR